VGLQLAGDANEAPELAVVAHAEHGYAPLAGGERHVQKATDLDDGGFRVVERGVRLTLARVLPVAGERAPLQVVLLALRSLPCSHRRGEANIRHLVLDGG